MVMQVVDVRNIGEKIKEGLTWEKLGDNLPAVITIGGIILILDKLVGLGDKLKPVTNWVKGLNEAEVYETIDTVGDNIQLVDLALRAFKVEIGKDDLKKIADFLQNVGTGGKYLSKLLDVVREKVPKGRRIGYKKGSAYKEIK